MSDGAVIAQGIGKQYLLGERESYHTLRENLSNGFKRLFSRHERVEARKFWAVRDLSFKVGQGQNFRASTRSCRLNRRLNPLLRFSRSV